MKYNVFVAIAVDTDGENRTAAEDQVRAMLEPLVASGQAVAYTIEDAVEFD